MTAPEGYTVLDFVGFTDRGGYDEAETYMENDLAHYGNTVWKCLVDDTSGVEPSEDAQEWEAFIEGGKPYYGTYATFPRPPLPKDKHKFFVDIETNPRLMYTWRDEEQDYVLTGGAGGADGGSVDIPLTLPATDWTGTSAPYSQTVTVPQMRVGMTPLITLTDTDDLTDAQRYAYSLLTDYDTAYAQMVFHAADLPAVDIPVTLKGIPAQEMEFVDNTVVLIVEPSGFALSEDPEYDGRYVSTIPCEGMSAGAEGGSWDIVRSGPVLTLEESKIAASITDVKCLDGAVMIVCTEVPEHGYLLKLIGTYKDAAPGDVILPNIQPYLDKVDELEAASAFSIDEVKIGTWVDGKPLYRKVISQSAKDFVVSELYTTYNITHNILNISRINKCYAYMQSGNAVYPLPYFNSNSGMVGTYVYIANATNISVRSKDAWGNYNIVIVIEYTKTTD